MENGSSQQIEGILLESLPLLPTGMNLAKRKLISDENCHCCKRAIETTIHAIQECDAAQDVWAGSLTSLHKRSTNCLDFMQLFESLLNKLAKPKIELFLVQAWIIWNQRNAVVHEGQLKDPGWLNKRVAEYLEEYKNAQENLATSNAVPSRIVWQTPPLDEYKLNFDAANFFGPAMFRVWSNNQEHKR